MPSDVFSKYKWEKARLTSAQVCQMTDVAPMNLNDWRRNGLLRRRGRRTDLYLPEDLVAIFLLNRVRMGLQMPLKLVAKEATRSASSVLWWLLQESPAWQFAGVRKHEPEFVEDMGKIERHRRPLIRHLLQLTEDWTPDRLSIYTGAGWTQVADPNFRPNVFLEIGYLLGTGGVSALIDHQEVAKELGARLTAPLFVARERTASDRAVRKNARRPS